MLHSHSRDLECFGFRRRVKIKHTVEPRCQSWTKLWALTALTYIKKQKKQMCELLKRVLNEYNNITHE